MAAQIEDTGAKSGVLVVEDVSKLPKGEIELEVEALQGKSDDEKLNYLLDRAKLAEREDQRDDDVSRDHGIRLFSRQKNQSLCRILTTLILLTGVYGIQLVALYNLNRASSIVDVNNVVKWIERGEWGSKDPAIDTNNVLTLPSQLRRLTNGSEIDIFDFKKYDFCLTPKGQLDMFFNIFVGLVMIYLFLFFDMWFVIFDMPLTRNWAYERHGMLMLFGVIWLVLMNSAIVTWLGVISGFSVIANATDFFSVLFTSLSLFIILVVDDTVLPAIRFLVEENGRLDEFGNLKPEVLKSLTHGCQYYKPGYGHRMFRLLVDDPNTPQRVLAFIAATSMLTIIVAPAVTTIVKAGQTFQAC